MKKIEATLILPCFNEAQHFEKSVKEILGVLRKTKLSWEVIFIDDKSTDETTEIIRSLLKTMPVILQGWPLQIRALFHQKNQGRGTTVTQGIKEAKGEIVGYIDIDCEVAPHYIPLFVEKVREGYDVVCAWRIYQFQLSSLSRYLASKIYLWLENILLGINFSDTEAGYKFFRRDKILPVLTKIKAKHWFWDTEVIVKAHRSGLKIAHIPTVFLRRRDKASTVRLLPDTIDYLKNLWRLRREIK